MMREVTTQRHMNERLAILLHFLPGASCALRRCFAGVGAASARFVRSFFVCGGYQFLVLEGPFGSLITLACSLRFVQPSP